jgi:hypothetical protein
MHSEVRSLQSRTPVLPHCAVPFDGRS